MKPHGVQYKVTLAHCLSLKFKATARALQSWSQKKIGHITSQLALAKEIIHQFDIAQDSRPLQPNELWLRNNLKKHTLALTSLLRTVARLRSQIDWLKEGDANTRLFHMHARHRRKISLPDYRKEIGFLPPMKIKLLLFWIFIPI